jgi:hypothetical protein
MSPKQIATRGLLTLAIIAVGTAGFVGKEGVRVKFDLGNRTIEGDYGPGNDCYMQETNNKLGINANPMRSIGGRGLAECFRTTGYAIEDGVEDIFSRR